MNPRGGPRAGDTTGDNKYLRAAGALKEWLKSGALRRDDKPAIYYHTIEYQPPYSAPGTPTKVFKGFLSTVELEEFGSGKIYPHENTRAAAKTDRLNLLEACKRTGCKKFVFASSSSVYGVNKKVPFSEEDAILQTIVNLR